MSLVEKKYYDKLIEHKIWNSNLEEKLKSLKPHLMNEFCEKLLYKKKILDRYNNQCIQLKLKSKFEASEWIDKLESLDTNKVEKEIDANIRKVKAERTNLLKMEKQKPGTKNIKKIFKHNSGKKRKQAWVRIISTPMYS